MTKGFMRKSWLIPIGICVVYGLASRLACILTNLFPMCESPGAMVCNQTVAGV